jgi:hypothetical protein
MRWQNEAIRGLATVTTLWELLFHVQKHIQIQNVAGHRLTNIVIWRGSETHEQLADTELKVGCRGLFQSIVLDMRYWKRSVTISVRIASTLVKMRTGHFQNMSQVQSRYKSCGTPAAAEQADSQNRPTGLLLAPRGKVSERDPRTCSLYLLHFKCDQPCCNYSSSINPPAPPPPYKCETEKNRPFLSYASIIGSF